MAALLMTLAFLAVGAPGAEGLLTGSDEEDFGSLEAGLRDIYKALPQNSQGLPEAAAVRYMARRYLFLHHGWNVKGLDTVPVHHGRNATERAALRVAEVLGVPGALAAEDRDALLAVLAAVPDRGFSLREAARVVRALERTLADAGLRLMRKAHSLSKIMRKGQSPQLHNVLENWATLYIGGSELQEGVSNKDLSSEDLSERMTTEVARLKKEFRMDNDGEPLEESARAAAKEAWSRQHGHSAIRAMERLRERFNQRQAGECRVYREVLSTLDEHGTGKVRFAEAYGARKNDWAFLETPDYLRAIGALDEDAGRKDDPDVIIPNYVLGMSSCREPGPTETALCCPDECETNILPYLEAAAGGPRATAKQIWFGTSQAMRSQGQVSTAKAALKSKLRRLAARSKDGLLALHGQALQLWLHQVFPLVCRKPLPQTSLQLLDPALLSSNWARTEKLTRIGRHTVKMFKEHLKTRWGPDGNGQDIHSIAARSSLGLDRELELIYDFSKVKEDDWPAVLEKLERAIKVLVMDKEPEEKVVHLFAAFFAASALSVLLPLLELLRRLGLFALPGRLISCAVWATSLAASTCCRQLAKVWAACTCAAATCAGGVLFVAAAAAGLPCACGRAVAAVGAGCARQLSRLWDCCAEAAAALTASTAAIRSAAIAGFARLRGSADSLVKPWQPGLSARALAWLAACVLGGGLTAAMDLAMGLGSGNDAYMEVVIILAMLVFALILDRIGPKVWSKMEAGGKLCSKELQDCCCFSSWTKSSTSSGPVYGRMELLRLRRPTEPQHGALRGLQIRSCAALEQAPSPKAAALLQAEAPCMQQPQLSEEDCSLQRQGTPTVEGSIPAEAPGLSSADVVPISALSGKERLLMEVLREERRRTPHGLSEKGQLLLDILCEVSTHASDGSQPSPQALPQEPPQEAPQAPFGAPLGLPPPPGLAPPPPPPGLQVW